MATSVRKLTICVVTYNQESYIDKCLSSLVEQDVGFDFEILVVDDCSTDSTYQIVKSFERAYPNIVRSVQHPHNIGALKNFHFAHAQAQGEYIAHMDGDDYALDGKLQAQVDFLNNNPQCSMVGHQTYIEDSSSGKISGVYLKQSAPKIANLEYLLKNSCYFAHSSKMYRKSLNTYTDVPEFCCDFWMHVWHASQGDIGYIEKPLGVYRTGIVSSLTGGGAGFRDFILNNHLQAYDLAALNGADHELVLLEKARFSLEHAIRKLMVKDFIGFNTWIGKSLEFKQGFSRKQKIFLRFKENPSLLFFAYRANLTFKRMLGII